MQEMARPPAPRLVITHGLSGSGKTWASGRWLQAEASGRAIRLRSDVERKRLHGLAPQAASGSGLNTGLYTAQAHGDTYASLLRRARGLLGDGWTVLVDAAFLRHAERASFADTHARVGVMPGWGLSVLLPQAVGLRRAREMSLTGNYVDAATALAWGLVNHVVGHDELVPAAVALAADVAANDPAAVASLLALYDETAATTVDEAWDLEGRRCRDWARTRLDPERIGAVRQAVVDRGRAQQR